MQNEQKANNERGFSLTRSAQDFRQKYAYFLLAAVGAAIGFAVTQTKDAMLGWPMAPLGLAVAAWAYSFFSGARYLHYISVLLYTNADIFKIYCGDDPECGDDITLQRDKTARILTDHFRPAERQSEKYYRHQLNAFFIGAALFLLWHILTMAIRASLFNP